MYFCQKYSIGMNFSFFQRPEVRKYNYIPQFYVEGEDKKTKDKEFDRDQFAERLHRSWDKKRQSRRKGISNFKSLICIILILVVLLYVYYKFLL